MSDSQIWNNFEVTSGEPEESYYPLKDMVAGIVHNISNPLTIIKVRTQILQTKNPENPVFGTLLENISRIEKIIGNLAIRLNESADPAARLLSLNNIINAELTYLEADLFFKHRIIRSTDLQESLPCIKAPYLAVSQGILAVIHGLVAEMKDNPVRNLDIRTSCHGPAVVLTLAGTGQVITAGDCAQFEEWLLSGRTETLSFKAPIDDFLRAYNYLSPYLNHFSLQKAPAGGTVCEIVFPSNQSLGIADAPNENPDCR